jgi:hypothetical protein
MVKFRFVGVLSKKWIVNCALGMLDFTVLSRRN